MPGMNDTTLTVCYFGTYRANYNRNQMMIAGLRLNGVKVIECHETLWFGIDDRVETTTGGWKKPSFWWRVIKAYARLFKKFHNVGDFDILWVGYPGQFDVYLAWILARLYRKPLVWDILMSIYLVAVERDLDQLSPFTVKMLKHIEKIAFRLPDILIQDTLPYIDWLQQTYEIHPDKFRQVPIGVDDRVFQAAPGEKPNDGIFRVVYYGTYIPNHGVQYIIEAARLLKDDKFIRFDFIGQGPDKIKARTLANEYNLQNVNFIEWMDKSDLVRYVANCDVCLGTFSTTKQSLMTVHNKVYEGMAMKKVVLTGDSLAVRNQFTHKKHIYLVERNDGVSLANGIQTLRDHPDLLSKIEESGHNILMKKYTLSETGRITKKHLENLWDQINPVETH